MRDFQLPGRSAVFAANGMCATSHPLAAQTAIHLLREGGNAVDAAIAAAVLLGICEPHSTGLGGDCFALVKPANEDGIIALNGSGRAPRAIDPDELRDRGWTSIHEYSAASVTVPGAVDAFCRLSSDWGRLGLERSLLPAIKYAGEGIPVSPRVSRDWKLHADVLQDDARKFYLSGGKPPVVGDKFRAPMQADVLRRIVSEGRAGFYEGEVAEDIVNSLRAVGGVHSLEDFAETECTYVDPISGSYKGMELIEHPPNGQGVAAILLANILSRFNRDGMSPFGAMRAHIEAEATKLAMDARNRFVADFDHVACLEYLMSQETADRLAEYIRIDGVLKYPDRIGEAVHRDTVYLTVVDRDRMVVSLIYSIFHGFGSGLASKRFGINFHNRGSGFNLSAGHPNEIGPLKRPLHTIIPAMLGSEGRIAMSFGVMGGQYQAVGHARFLTNHVDFDMHPQAALDGPRSFAEDGVLLVERGYDESVCRELEELGHKVERPASPLGGGQAIHIDYEKGTLDGASDPRKDGCAIGY